MEPQQLVEFYFITWPDRVYHEGEVIAALVSTVSPLEGQAVMYEESTELYCQMGYVFSATFYE